MITQFRLYRAGPVIGAPWSDAQLWADGRTDSSIPLNHEVGVRLDPLYGSAAAWYMVNLLGEESAEPGWQAARARLTVDGQSIGPGWLPLAWYVGAVTDWPSGLARFPEVYPADDPHKPAGSPLGRHVWTLAAMRIE